MNHGVYDGTWKGSGEVREAVQKKNIFLADMSAKALSRPPPYALTDI